MTIARRLLAGTALTAVALTAAPAIAQSITTTTSATATPGEAAPEIVVTGSLFKRGTATESPSPVTVLTPQVLQSAGITTINDAIRSVSADGAGSISTGFQGGFSSGGAAVSLRGLGVSSTLILIDGLRTSNFPLNDDGHNAYTDLNSIPFAQVERIDVLKDGASSTYGADAIGGVVNIIMRKHYKGVDGSLEGGASGKGYGGRIRGNLTGGIGDYDQSGWNFWVGGEYQHDSRISVNDVGFPFNTTDLSSIGLADQNTADSSLSTATLNAYVRRSGQTNINDPFSGTTPLAGDYTTLYNNCPGNTFTVTTANAGGVGCRNDITRQYSQVQPRQDRYSIQSRLSFRLNDNIEGYVTGSYSFNEVNVLGLPTVGRNRQPYGGAPTTSSLNLVLPYFVCSAGVNCITAADKRLNPNNPYATDINATAAVAGANAARIYAAFPGILSQSDRKNHVVRGAAGLSGSFSEGWDWKVDATAAKDYLSLTSFSSISIAGLAQAVNTGAYNFRDPFSNSTAVLRTIAPIVTAKSNASQAALDVSTTKTFFQLPSGQPLAVAVGGQVRRETLENNSLNPTLSNYANTAAAFGKHTVSAVYFEVDAPILKQFEVNASGRYDHYSEGFSHFSPKIGAKFTPIEQLAFRGTFSKGFRAPTFAESNPASSYPGFVTYQPPANFVAAHGGSTNPYAQSYSVGGGFSGNPNLKPEKSRSFTGGLIASPTRWLNLTVDYYNVKKTGTIVAGPDAGKARAAYYSQTTLPAAIAAVAALPGYSVSAVDSADPLFPNALPRVLVISGPYVNAGYFKTQGLDFGLNLNFKLNQDLRFQSRVDVTDILKYDADFGDGVVRKYVGTMGPYELSSGAGTPKIRGNWQNTITYKNFSLSATTYYVSRIKQVAADEEAPNAQGVIDLSCATAGADLGYPYPGGAPTQSQCYIKKFIYSDLNLSVDVDKNFSFYVNVGNFTNARAPVAPTSYSGVNYLPTWHMAGVIGRTFRAGASFKFK